MFTAELWDYDTNERFGPASAENEEEYLKALSAGKAFFSRGYHGYTKRFVIHWKVEKPAET